jgi:hypothetical protein
MRAAEARARADEMKEAHPKAIMLRIAADYEELAEWTEKNYLRSTIPRASKQSFGGRGGLCGQRNKSSQRCATRRSCARAIHFSMTDLLGAVRAN